MLNRSNTRHSRRLVAALALGAVVVVLVARQTKSPAVRPSKPLSPVEQKLVGTWAYPAEQFGESIIITFSRDRTYTHTNSDSVVHPARWRIDGPDLIIEQKVRTVVGGLPSLPIPDAIRRLQLPKAMWYAENITQTVSFSDTGDLQLGGVWLDSTLVRCETPKSNMRSKTGIIKP